MNQTTTPAEVGSNDELGRDPCDCMEQVNKNLMERGYVVVMRDIVRFKEGQPGQEIGSAPLLQVERIGKAKCRAPGVYGPFCMFCGQRRWPAA